MQHVEGWDARGLVYKTMTQIITSVSSQVKFVWTCWTCVISRYFMYLGHNKKVIYFQTI